MALSVNENSSGSFMPPLSPNSANFSKSKSFINEQKTEKTEDRPLTESQKLSVKPSKSNQIPVFFTKTVDDSELTQHIAKIVSYFGAGDISRDSSVKLVNDLTGLHKFFCLHFLNKIPNFNVDSFKELSNNKNVFLCL